MTTMRISIHHKDVGGPRYKLLRARGKSLYIPLGLSYHWVHWGTSSESYNRNFKKFRDWNKAVAYAKTLAEKYGRMGYRVSLQRITD